ncbi:hypothetical protein [Sorangium sp. So ce124]|uniref:hypothetical protein n=1 Tax=Sorangium sp. So ce124 TaxID=3133280 RepID=UPI003F602E20
MTWIADKAVKKSAWRTPTGRGSRKKAKRAVPSIADQLTSGGFPTNPAQAKKQLGKRFPKGPLFNEAEWNAFEQLSSTPQGQRWLNASGMLTLDQAKQYLSDDEDDNPEKFRGFHQLHKPSKVVLASYVSRQRNSGESGQRFDGTPPAAVALSMEARHTTDPARRDALKREIDQGIAAEWAKTLEHTEPNDDATTAIAQGAVPNPTGSGTLSNDDVLDRHHQSIEVLTNVFHLLQEGAEIYDAGAKSHVPLRDVPVAKLLSHGGRVNIQIPAGTPPYAVTELLGITDSHGNPKAGVFPRAFGTHHVALGKGKFKEEGGHVAAIKSKFDDTELYGINLAIGGLGLKDFNGDVILPDGAHGHIFIGHRPPRQDRPGALQIGIETTGPNAPSTVGYIHNWRSTEKTANPISSVGGLKQDKIGDDQIKNARTVDLGKLGDDWAGVLKDRADRFAEDVKDRPAEAIQELVGPRANLPQDTPEVEPRDADEASDEAPDDSDRDSRDDDEASDEPSDGSERDSEDDEASHEPPGSKREPRDDEASHEPPGSKREPLDDARRDPPGDAAASPAKDTGSTAPPKAKEGGFFATMPLAKATGDGDGSTADLEAEAMEVLKAQETLRIFIPRAPGNGHQGASVQFMKRLAQLGFKGEFDVVYDDSNEDDDPTQEKVGKDDKKYGLNRPKLESLLPGFKANGAPIQRLETSGLKVNVMGLKTFQAQSDPRPARYGLTGAVDNHEKPKEILDDLKVSSFVQLQPMDWNRESGKRGITYRDSEGKEQFHEVESLAGLGYIYDTTPPDDPRAMIEDELEKTGAQAKAPGVLAFLEQTKNDPNDDPTTHTMVVYGLGTGEAQNSKAPVFELFNLITGILYAQAPDPGDDSAGTDLQNKGVILGAAGWVNEQGELDQDELDTLNKMLNAEWEGGLQLVVDNEGNARKEDWEALADHLKQRLFNGDKPRAAVINIEDAETPERIADVKPGEVLVVEFSPKRLPMPVFELLRSRTSLPNGFESVNGMDKERQNKPYFHVGKDMSNNWPGSDVLPDVPRANALADRAKLVGQQLQGHPGLKNWGLNYNDVKYVDIFTEIADRKPAVKLKSPRTGREVKLKVRGQDVTGEGDSPAKGMTRNGPYGRTELAKLYKDNRELIDTTLRKKDPDRVIGRFLNDTQKPDSGLRKYFDALKERSATSDQVKIAFTELIRVEKNPPSPPADDGMWTAPETGASAGDQSPAPGKGDDRAGAGDTAAAQSAPAGSAAPAPSRAELIDRGMERGLRGSALDDYTSRALETGDPDPNSYLKSLVEDIKGMPSGFKERAKELLEHPERIDQQDFAFCGLTAIAEAALHNNPMKAIDVFRSLFDATPFPLESGGAIDVTPSAEEVARGKDPSRNVLLGGRIKQIESMSEHTGKDYGDKRLDILLARALPKLWKTRANDKYDAWRESVESKFDANFGQGREQLQGDGARLKRGDFPMSDEAYTGILQDVFEAHEVNVLSAGEAGYDIDAINELLEDDASAQFVHGIVLAGPVSAAAKGGGLGAPMGSSAGDQGLHQVRIVGPIETTTTPDGAESYVVPLSTYGKVIRLPVPKDEMGTYFPHILTGRWHEPAPPRAVDSAQGSPSAAAPKSAAPSTGTSELFATMPKDKTTGDPERDEEEDGEELASFINGLDEIRAYVPQGPGLGHQSSTINLVRRIVDQFDFQGTLRIVYDDSGTKQLLDDRAEARRKQERGEKLNPLEKSSLIERTVEEKLALLVPGFNPAQGAGEQTVKLGAAQLVFTPESKAGGLPSTPFGFTGGYDNKSDNLAVRLKSDHVLKLQPFGWAHPRGRWARQPDEESREKIAKLKEQLGKRPPLAQQRQIKRELAALEAKQFTEMPSLDAKAHKWAVAGPEEFKAALSTTGPKGALVRHLMSEIDRGKPVIPLYGMGHAERAQDAPASHELFSLIAGTARAQQKDPGQFPEGVALVVTASLTADHYRDLDALIHGPRDAGQRVLQNTTGGRGWNNPALDAFDSTVEELGLKERLLRVTVDDTEESVAKAMQAISELRQDQILLVQLGGFPPAVFEVFFSYTNMMGVLEGPNTANMMMSQGKPFVKGGGAAKEQLGAPPSKHGFEGERVLIDKVSETLNGNLSSWLPGDAGPGLQRKDEDIADYLLSLGGEGSQIREYHRSLGDEYTSPNADAFADGMKDIIRAVRDGTSEPTGAPAGKESGFFATAPQTSAPASGTPGASDRLSDFVNGQSEIRAYIPHAPGFGHQSSTINLIRRIADQLEYEGTVRVVYDDGGTAETLKQREDAKEKQASGQPLSENERSILGDKTIEEKLAILVPGFDASKGAGEQTVTLGTTRIVFTPESKAKQLPPAKFGFTAGYDSSDNLAERLNSDHVLKLQPYGWQQSRGIWKRVSDQTKRELETIEQALKNSRTPAAQKRQLRDRRAALQKNAFVEMPSLNGKAHTWAIADKETFEETLPALGAKAELVTHIVSEIDRDKPAIMLYGLGHPEKAKISPASHELFNLIAGAARAQQQSPDKFPKGAALVVTANLDEPDYNKLDALIHDPRGAGRDVLTNSEGGDRWTDEKVGAFADAVGELGLADRFRRITVDDTEESVKRAIDAMSTMGEDQILLIQLGGSPPAVFEVLFSHTNMMGVLEGPNTANMMMSQGKPFVKGGGGAAKEQLRAPELEDKGAFAGERALIDKVSETLNGNLSSWLPSDASPGLQRKDEDLADYLVSLRDGDSPLRKYHESLRDEYTSPERDAFAEGMQALITLAQESGGEGRSGAETLWGAPSAAASTGMQDPAPGAQSAQPKAGGKAGQTTPAGSQAGSLPTASGPLGQSRAELIDRGMERGLRGSALDDYTSRALETGDPDPNSYLKSLVDNIGGMPSGFKERAKELLEHPERIDQQDFAFCGLTAIAESVLHDNPMKAIDVFRSLFDATPFPLESGGAIDVTPSAEEVARGKDPSRNVLLGGRIKQIESMSEHTGKDYGDKRLDVMLARALPKLWKTRARDSYDAWIHEVEQGFDKDFAQKGDQLAGDGARLKRGDFPMSEEAYTGILGDVLEANDVNVMSSKGGEYDIDAINRLFDGDGSGRFVHGIVLAAPVDAEAKKYAPLSDNLGPDRDISAWSDPASSFENQALHQVRIVGPIETTTTPDGADAYVVPISSYGKTFPFVVRKDRMGEYFPNILTGSWHRPAPPLAAEQPTSAGPAADKGGFFATSPAPGGQQATTADSADDTPADGAELQTGSPDLPGVDPTSGTTPSAAGTASLSPETTPHSAETTGSERPLDARHARALAQIKRSLKTAMHVSAQANSTTPYTTARRAGLERVDEHPLAELYGVRVISAWRPASAQIGIAVDHRLSTSYLRDAYDDPKKQGALHLFKQGVEKVLDKYGLSNDKTKSYFLVNSAHAAERLAPVLEKHQASASTRLGTPGIHLLEVDLDERSSEEEVKGIRQYLKEIGATPSTYQVYRYVKPAKELAIDTTIDNLAGLERLLKSSDFRQLKRIANSESSMRFIFKTAVALLEGLDAVVRERGSDAFRHGKLVQEALQNIERLLPIFYVFRDSSARVMPYYDPLIDELFLMLVAARPYGPDDLIAGEEQVQDERNPKVKELVGDASVDRAIHPAWSGMDALVTALEAARQVSGDSVHLLHDTDRAQANYFEVPIVLGAQGRVADPGAEMDAGIVFATLDPSAPVSQPTSPADVIEAVKGRIARFEEQESSGARVVSLVLDTTIQTKPRSDGELSHVDQVVSELAPLVKEGKLQILLARSYQKYQGLGSAKVMGGAVTLLRSTAGAPESRDFLKNIDTKGNTSRDEWQFFTHVLKNASDNELGMIGVATENAKFVADHLFPRGGGSPYVEGLPFLMKAFQVEQYMKSLDLLQLDSFGLVTSTFLGIESAGTRVTIGQESKHRLVEKFFATGHLIPEDPGGRNLPTFDDVLSQMRAVLSEVDDRYQRQHEAPERVPFNPYRAGTSSDTRDIASMYRSILGRRSTDGARSDLHLDHALASYLSTTFLAVRRARGEGSIPVKLNPTKQDSNRKALLRLSRELFDAGLLDRVTPEMRRHLSAAWIEALADLKARAGRSFGRPSADAASASEASSDRGKLEEDIRKFGRFAPTRDQLDDEFVAEVSRLLDVGEAPTSQPRASAFGSALHAPSSTVASLPIAMPPSLPGATGPMPGIFPPPPPPMFDQANAVVFRPPPPPPPPPTFDPADTKAGYNPAAAQGAKGSPAPTTGATTADSPSGAEQATQPQGSPLEDLIRTIDEQSSTWPRPADGEHREEAAKLLSRLLQAQGVSSSVVERLSTLIKDPASLSQSAFTNCALHSVLYTTLKSDLATASHLVVALFTGKLLGRLAGAPGAGTFGQRGSGSPALSEGLELILNQMKGEGLSAPGPAPTRPLVNGLKTAKAKHDRLKGQGASTQDLDGHLLDHLLARGLVELLGRTAVAALEKQTDDAREPGVAAAEGDLLVSARSTAALMNAALGAGAKIMTTVSPGGYDVARINEALGKPDQAGFALATVMNGKALWEEAAKHGAGASTPQDPETIPRLDKVDTSSPHLVAIDGPITVHGDSFLVPIQSWGRAFPVRVAKQDMPKLFAAFAYGTYPPARTPQASASAEVNPQASGGAADALTGMAPRVQDFDSPADWRRFNERVRPWLGEIHRIRQPHDLRGAIDALSAEAARLLLRLYDEDPQRARVELRRLGRFNMNDTRRLSALLDRLTESEASDTELMEVELLSELEAIEQAQGDGEASDTDSFDLDDVLAFQGQLDALESAQSEFNQWMQEQLDGDPSEPEDAGEEQSESGDSDAGMSESARLARANVQGMDQLHTAGRVQYSFNVPSEDLDELTEVARNAGVQGELADARTGFLNPDHFEKQSSYTWRLRPGVSASKALREFFNPEEHLTIAECGTTMQAINYRTILRAVGEEDFDRRFGGEDSSVPNEDRLLLQRDFSAQNPLQRFFAPEAATLDDEERAEMTGEGGEDLRNAPSSRPAKRGGWYYIKNHELYSRRHPEGFWSGENAMYLGRDRASGEQLFSGFGVAPTTEEQLADTLASEFNQEPTETEVEKILGSGRDLSLALPTLGDLDSIADMPLTEASMNHIARLHGHPGIDAAPREAGETGPEDVARRLFRETLEGQPLQQPLSHADLVASLDLSELDRRALEAGDPAPAERSLGTWGVRAVPGAEGAAASHDAQAGSAGTPRAVLRWTRPSSSRHGGQHTTPYTLVFDGYCKRFNFTFTPALMNLFLDLNRDSMRPVNPSDRTVRKTTKIRVDEGAEFIFPLPSEVNKLAKVPGGFQSIGGKALSAEQIRREFGREELFSGAPSPASPADVRAGYRPQDAASGRSDGAQTATAASTTRGEGSASDGAIGDTQVTQADTQVTQADAQVTQADTQVTQAHAQATQATGAPAALDGAVPIPARIDALVRTLVAKSDAWSSPRTQVDKQEAIALVTELLQQLGMDARVVDRAGEQGKDTPDSEHSTCTCVR